MIQLHNYDKVSYKQKTHFLQCEKDYLPRMPSQESQRDYRNRNKG